MTEKSNIKKLSNEGIGMKNWYVVTFKWSEKVYCTNLCVADSTEQAEGHYKNKYECVSVRAAYDWEVESYKKRGMPITEL